MSITYNTINGHHESCSQHPVLTSNAICQCGADPSKAKWLGQCDTCGQLTSQGKPGQECHPSDEERCNGELVSPYEVPA